MYLQIKQLHDTQLGWEDPKRNLHRVETITADKGYDWDELRHFLGVEGFIPVIKNGEVFLIDADHNTRIQLDLEVIQPSPLGG